MNEPRAADFSSVVKMAVPRAWWCCGCRIYVMKSVDDDDAFIVRFDRAPKVWDDGSAGLE